MNNEEIEVVKRYKNGNIKKKGKRVNGSKDGRWVYYHKNGNIRKQYHYKYGLLRGMWLHYENNKVKYMCSLNKDGVIEESIFYNKNGKKNSVWTTIDIKGVPYGSAKLIVYPDNNGGCSRIKIDPPPIVD